MHQELMFVPVMKDGLAGFVMWQYVKMNVVSMGIVYHQTSVNVMLLGIQAM